MSRKEKSFKNLVTSYFGLAISILLKFITRTVFIYVLGIEYLGITGLFTNIMSILALTELGIGTAITFHLYKPLAQKDHVYLRRLVDFYKIIFRYIGLAIGIIGIIILPFIPSIIKDDVSHINLHLIFIIYLLQTLSSYLFYAYKSTLIRADQKEYVINTIKSYFSVITSIVQIVILLVFENYTLFIFSVVVTNIIMNLVIASRADRMFPYLEGMKGEKLSKKEKKEIFKDAYAVFLYKINGKVQNSSDNIVLSYFMGLNIVGMYMNYLMISQSLDMILSRFYAAIVASLSDLHARGDIDYEYKLFKIIGFFTIYIYGMAAVIVFNVINIFMVIWLGEQYVLNSTFPLLLSITIFIGGYQKLFETFRNSMGLFQQAKYRYVAGIVINIGLSLILVQYMGINGVILATIISNLFTFMWFDPLVIQRHGFNKSPKSFYITNLKFSLAIISAGFTSQYIISLIHMTRIPAFILFSILTMVCMMLIMHILFGKTYEYNYIWKMARQTLKSLNKRRKKSI